MQVEPLAIPAVLCLTPRVFSDTRGLFFESFNARTFAQNTGVTADFVQDNVSRSARHVLRGLHYQIAQAQGKLVRVSHGEILDVAVDLRRSSATFGAWVSQRLSSENHKQLWIPAGFAHGFVALSDDTEVNYKTTDFYAPQHERTIRWDDPDLAIDWQIDAAPLLSDKDGAGAAFADAETFA